LIVILSAAEGRDDRGVASSLALFIEQAVCVTVSDHNPNNILRIQTTVVTIDGNTPMKEAQNLRPISVEAVGVEPLPVTGDLILDSGAVAIVIIPNNSSSRSN
jgi:hypothetical protein